MYRHAELLEEFFAMLLQEVGQVGEGLAFGLGLGDGTQPAREAVENRQPFGGQRFEPGVTAAPLAGLPERFALA